MNDNSFEALYDVTKKSKLKKLYESNKILIFTSILVLIVTTASISIYLNIKEDKRILLEDNYIEAKV